MARNLANRNKSKWAFLPHGSRANTQLAVFVHGFRGDYLDTWGKLPDMLQANTDSDEPFASWDYVFVGYETRNVETYLDIATLLATELRAAISGDRRYGRRYDRFALYGHSLGTLGLRQFLCASTLCEPGMASRIHSVTFFGSPINGSSLARLAFSYKIGDALKPSNPQLRMLREWSRGAFAGASLPQTRLIVGQDDMVVGDTAVYFSDWPNDQWPPSVTTYDHSDMTKPDTWPNAHVVDYLEAGLR